MLTNLFEQAEESVLVPTMDITCSVDVDRLPGHITLVPV